MTRDLQAARERVQALSVSLAVRSIPRILGPLLGATLTFQQLKVLTSIVVSDGATARDLVTQFDVSKATVSKMLDRLVVQELVERVVDDGDHRVRRLRATDRGREVVSELMGMRPELGEDVLEGLSLEEIRGLELGMSAISREMKRLSDPIAE